MPRRSLLIATATLVAALAALTSSVTQAHKAITSKYTFNEHVFPIVRDRCGRCHVDGGPTPMSLMTYKDAAPWAESIREQLTTQAMPPWFADPLGPVVKGGHLITAKELDVLLTWAVGGTPEGDAAKAPPPVTLSADWKSGTPDATLQMPAAHTVPAGALEAIHEFTVATPFAAETWVRSVDLLPGTPSMTRSAIIAVEGGPVLAAWVPGHDATPAPGGTAFRVPAGARLRVRMSYRKHWQDEAIDKADRSTIGIYVTDPPVSGRAIESMSVDAPSAAAASRRTFGTTMKAAARVLGVRATLDQPYEALGVDAVLPMGRRMPLLRLTAAQPRWPRRYWLTEPIDLPAGTTLEVTAVPAAAGEFSIPTRPDGPLNVTIDYVRLVSPELKF